MIGAEDIGRTIDQIEMALGRSGALGGEAGAIVFMSAGLSRSARSAKALRVAAKNEGEHRITRARRLIWPCNDAAKTFFIRKIACSAVLCYV